GDPNNNFAGYVVQPGDYISAEVKPGGICTQRRGGGQPFTVTMSDMQQNWTFTTTSCLNAQQSSAEWIAETPYGCSTRVGYCPLTNFGIADYGEDYAPFPDTASASVGAIKNAAISSFGTRVQQITLVTDDRSSSVMAYPTALTDKESPADAATSFTI